METQLKRIREHLNRGKKLTELDALYQYGCYSLQQRIYDLRREGMDIKTDMITITSPSLLPGREGKKVIAQYSLNK
jgi:hypothetical protein